MLQKVFVIIALIAILCFAIACGDDDDDPSTSSGQAGDDDDSEDVDDDLNDDADDDSDDDSDDDADDDCDDGEIWDGELGQCIPEQCGLDKYPQAPDEDKTLIYVDASYTGDSDGSDDKPYKTVSEAIAVAGEDASILVAAGDYVEADTLIIETDGLDLVGRCPDLVKVTNSDLRTVLQVDDSNFNLLTGIGYSAEGDSDFTFPLVKISQTNKLEFKGNTVADSKSKGISVSSSERILISGNKFENCAEEGIYINSSSGEITENEVADNQYRGISVQNSEEISISDNTVERNAGTGIFFTDSSGTIAGNEIRDTGLDEDQKFGRGIGVQYSENVEVTGNVVEGNTGAGIFFAVSGGTISGNEVRDTGPDGLGTGGYGIEVFECAEATVSDNLSEANTIAGILFNDANGTISDNEVRDNNGRGINVENSGDVSVTGNTVTGHEISGVFFNYSGGSISDNDVQDTIQTGRAENGCAVAVQHSEDVVVSGNNVEDNHVTAVCYVDSSGAINENNVHDNFDRGINLEGSSGVTVADNTVESNVAVGIIFDDSSGTISGNHVCGTLPDDEGTFGRGIVVQDSGLTTVSLNIVENNTEVGIFFADSPGVISGNEVSGTLAGAPNNEGYTAGHGIHVQESSDVECSGNTLEDNLHAGIFYIQTTNGNIQNNEVTGTLGSYRDTTDRGDGIIVLGADGYIYVQDNTLEANNRCGVLTDSATGMIQRNEITMNENSVVTQNDSTMDVSDNNIYGNDFDNVQDFESRQLPVNDSMIERNG